MGDVFTAQFADFHFNEINFLTLGGGIKNKKKEIAWNVSLLSYLDPRIDQCELEVQKIFHCKIKQISYQRHLYSKKVTKPHIVVANVPLKIDIPTQYVVINEFGTRQKRSRPVGSKD